MRKFSNQVSNFWSEQNISRKITSATFLKLFLNAIIMNIKIHNIRDIIKISNSMELNKCICKWSS
jgi:hypothetical protein